ncbi:hypothetical protein B0T14DRAFT_522696 [Immersiella caudata]|uniref:DUF7580 domain-containing protein n=1 Tax=Immersiella caudata TaxID=314043 RepID=A0AA39WIW1_9PEZI|nr:hypothetical protein B0T14DRAFT_522696 [Immersiella caudata]
MKVCRLGGNDPSERSPTIKSFDELRRDSSLSTKYKLELAIRLSLAVLQLSNMPWVSESWTWNDVCVTEMEASIPRNEKASKSDSRDGAHEKAESSVLFILHKRIYSVTYYLNSETASPIVVVVPRAVNIIDEEPAMTKLAFALIELALGRSIKELKEEYGLHEMPEDDTTNIYTAFQLLRDGKIREEAGREYEMVVDVCLKRRFVDSRGVLSCLGSDCESFLSRFRESIVRPLYLMWRNH